MRVISIDELSDIPNDSLMELLKRLFPEDDIECWSFECEDTEDIWVDESIRHIDEIQ